MNLAETRSHVPLINVPKKKKAKKAIRKVAKKRGPLNAQYMKLREEFLKAHPYCEYCLLEAIKVCPSTEIHHKKGRGKYLLDTTTWMAVSNEGHKAIHADPKTSYAKGYMLPRR